MMPLQVQGPCNGRIFLCHSSADKEAVRRLYHRLRADGFNPWFDEEDLLPGQDWQLEIPKAVRSSTIVLVCLSRFSVNKSGYIQKEIKYALDVADQQPEGAIFIIPVRIEECIVPDRLSQWQWVDLFEEQGYSRILRALIRKGLTTQPVRTQQPDAQKTSGKTGQEEQERERRAAEEKTRLDASRLRTPAVHQQPEGGAYGRSSSRAQYQDGVAVAGKKVVSESLSEFHVSPQKRVWVKVAISAVVILIAAAVVYWIWSRSQSVEQTEGNQKLQPQAATFTLASLALQSGWAVGRWGTILHTEDGGATWKKQTSGTEEALMSVAFATPQSGWAVGRDGIILHTEDGGGTWNAQTSTVETHTDPRVTSEIEMWLDSVVFTTPQSGWAVGRSGTILHTENGGRSWERQTSGIRNGLYSIAFATPQAGWAVGEDGAIVHTEDGGATWRKQTSGIRRHLYSVTFAAAQAGWAVSWSGTILHTEDGGRSWSKQTSDTREYLNCITFVTAQAGWAVGDKGTILHTEDGGATWKMQTSGTEDALISVAFATPQSGWVIGDKGIILRTDDGGATWKRQDSGTGEELRSVTFAVQR